MTEKTKLWQVGQDNKLVPLEEAALDYEENLEKWLEEDISILDEDLMLIGRQVPTVFTGKIDILCMNQAGDLLVVELKRGLTHREVVAQALDYCACIKDWDRKKVIDTAAQIYGDEEGFTKAFCEKYRANDLPETLNGQQHARIVGSQIDEGTNRIVDYLSDTFGVGINAATFQMLRGEAGQFIARNYTVAPGKVEYSSRTKQSSKKRRTPSLEEFESIARQAGVYEIYEPLMQWATETLSSAGSRVECVSFNIGNNVVFNLWPTEDYSSQSDGLCTGVYVHRLAEHLGVNDEEIISLLPEDSADDSTPKSLRDCGVSYECFFKTKAEVEKFTTGLQKLFDLKNKE